MNLKEKLRELSDSSQQNYEKNLEKLLTKVGLEKRRSTPDVLFPALGIFGAGLAVGATLGVLFAPKRGDELRGDLRKRLEDLKARSSEQYEELKTRSEEAIEELNKQVKEQKAKTKNKSDKASKTNKKAKAQTQKS